jgi:hypothetical protein
MGLVSNARPRLKRKGLRRWFVEAGRVIPRENGLGAEGGSLTFNLKALGHGTMRELRWVTAASNLKALRESRDWSTWIGLLGVTAGVAAAGQARGPSRS